MAITISGENNNDKILAQDGVIDTISGFNIAGIITASSFTGDLTGDVTGNLTGNVNNSSNLLLQIGGTEKLRVNSDRIIIGQSLSNNQPSYNTSTTFVTTHTNNPGAWNAIAIISGNSTGASFVKFGDRDSEAASQIGHYNVDNSLRFYTDGANERLRINANGNITISGITTSNTGFMFGTDGEMYLYKSAANTATLRITSDGPYAEFKDVSGDVQIGSASGTLLLSAGGNEKLRINSGGQVLIGTTSGNNANKIHARLANGSIANTSNQSVILAENSSNTWITIGSGASSYGGILFADNGSSDIGQVRYNHSTNALEFLTNGGNSSNIRLKIDSNGRILIGHDSTPAAALSLAIVGSYGGSATTTPFLYLCRDEIAIAISGAESLGQILFASNDGYRGAVIEAEAAGSWSGSSSDASLVFKTTPDNTTVPTEKLRITSDGKVGIGTDNPTNNLQVNAASNESTISLFNAGTKKSAFQASNSFGTIIYSYDSEPLVFSVASGTSFSEKLRITSGGQVRLGNSDITTSSAADDLIIGPNTPSGDHGITIISGTSGTGNIYFSDTDTTGVQNRMGTITYSHNDNYFRFSTNGNSEKLRITSDGKVGINETNPSSMLHVEQDNSHSTYYLNTDAAILVQNKNSNASAKTVIKLEGPVGGGDCAFVYGSSSTNLIISDRQHERLRITDAGKIGINETDPEANVEINRGSEGKYLVIGGDDANNGRALTFTSSEGGTGSNGALHTINAKSGNGAIAFATTGNEALRITNNGDVLIGRTSEVTDTKVVVAGNINHYNSDTGTGASTKIYTLGRSYNMSTSATNLLTFDNWGTAAFEITVFRRDNSSPAGANVSKIYLAFHGSGTNITQASIAQESKVTRGSIHGTTFSISENNNTATLKVTGDDNGGESQDLTFYIVGRGNGAGTIAVV